MFWTHLMVCFRLTTFRLVAAAFWRALSICLACGRPMMSWKWRTQGKMELTTNLKQLCKKFSFEFRQAHSKFSSPQMSVRKF